jgi:DNA-binding transcriptional regulator YdaS (Cro superfamily)
MPGMTLDDYLTRPGAPSAAEFATSLGFHEGQVRQWRHGYAAGSGKPRVPSPENCVVIERATGGLVTRKDLRPDDWERIWPELAMSAKRPKRGVAAHA